MPQITVEITQEQAELFQEAIAAGEYTDVDHLVFTALSQWETDRWLNSPAAPTVERLRALFEEGKASGPAEPLDWDKFMKDVQAQAAALKSRVA